MSIGVCNETQTPGKLELFRTYKGRWQKQSGERGYEVWGTKSSAGYAANLKKQRNTFLQDAKIQQFQDMLNNNNALKVLTVQWAVEKGILPEGIKCWTEQLQEGG